MDALKIYINNKIVLIIVIFMEKSFYILSSSKFINIYDGLYKLNNEEKITSRKIINIQNKVNMILLFLNKLY